MKTNDELKKMSVEDLEKESETHWQYRKKVDIIIAYKKAMEFD